MTNYRKLGVDVGNLVDEKQTAYGDSYGKSGRVLEVLYPDGVRVDQYPTFLAVTRVIDKLFRVATKKDAFGESPWKDIAGYALLGLAADESPVKLVKGSFGHATEEELVDERRVDDIKKHLANFAREYHIPVLTPADDRPIRSDSPPDVDLMGMRILRNSDRCCDHPERGICECEETERIGPTAEDIEGVS